jgi:hypothetical protein
MYLQMGEGHQRSDKGAVLQFIVLQSIVNMGPTRCLRDTHSCSTHLWFRFRSLVAEACMEL